MLFVSLSLGHAVKYQASKHHTDTEKFSRVIDFHLADKLLVVKDQKAYCDGEGYHELLGRWLVDTSDCANEDDRHNLGTFAEKHEGVTHYFHSSVAEIGAAKTKERDYKIIVCA